LTARPAAHSAHIHPAHAAAGSAGSHPGCLRRHLLLCARRLLRFLLLDDLPVLEDALLDKLNELHVGCRVRG